MRRDLLRVLTLLCALPLVAAGPSLDPRPPAARAGGFQYYLPLISKPPACPLTSGIVYAQGPVRQWDLDNPVRPAWNHADKNLALRSYRRNPGAFLGFENLTGNDPKSPQLATLFGPYRVPDFTSGYQVYNWNWQPSPNPGTRASSVDTNPDVTVLGLGVTPGEGLHVPTSGYDLGGGMAVIVLYADAHSITFKYTREDSVAPNGYTLHVDNLCTDPNLLALYQSLDGGPRYVYYGPPPGHAYEYNLPNLPAGQVFGTALDNEIRVAIVDTGSFMDPRSCNDWWQVRPNRSCP